MPHLFPSLKWSVAVGVAQAALVVGVLGLCSVRTVADWDGMSGSFCTVGSERRYFRGYPVPWEVKRQRYVITRYGSSDGRDWGTVERSGFDPVAPVAMFAIALTLPLILARAMTPEVQPREGESTATASRLDRNLQRVLLWSVGAFVVSWVLFLVSYDDVTPVPSESPAIAHSEGVYE